MALYLKKFGIGLATLGVVWFALAFFASPAWAQTAAELTVDKTDSPDPVTEGQIINYSIEVTNTGEEPATDVVLTDNLPAGTAFVSVSTTAGTCPTTPDEGDFGTVTCNLGDIAPGELATVAIEVRATQAGTVENTATATSDDVTVTDTIRTRILPDLVIDKLDDPDPVSGVEQLLLYTIRGTTPYPTWPLQTTFHSARWTSLPWTPTTSIVRSQPVLSNVTSLVTLRLAR